jgi:FKBP-type peptidyl-prolyl cis-trans isomerase FkpA
MLKKLVFTFVAAGAIAGCNGNVLGAGRPSDPATEKFHPSLSVDISEYLRTEAGVYYRDSRVGTGDEAAAADQVTITFAGYLASNGTLFASQSTPTQQPLSVFVQGFRDGVVGMRVGGVRRLVIPSALAYGWQGRQQGGQVIVPRNATLVFDVELFAVTKPTTTTQ